MTWQPIETAPKDGTDFLGYWVDRFDPRHENSCEIRTRHNLYQWENIFLEAGKDFRPTHWKPLPEPPDETEGRG
jgi:hypothetical protein